MRVTLTLASLAMVAITACAAPPSDTDQDLLGQDVAVLREHLGPPVELSAGHGVLRLAYRDHSGEVIEDAVIVLGRTVAKVREGLAPNRAQGIPAELTLVPVQEAIARLGPVQSVNVGSASARVQFAGWTATVVGDLVLGLRKT